MPLGPADVWEAVSTADHDGDGEADWHCAGGTDCDDLDPAVNPGTPEDLDGLVDAEFQHGCVPHPHLGSDRSLEPTVGMLKSYAGFRYLLRSAQDGVVHGGVAEIRVRFPVGPLD